MCERFLGLFFTSNEFYMKFEQGDGKGRMLVLAQCERLFAVSKSELQLYSK